MHLTVYRSGSLIIAEQLTMSSPIVYDAALTPADVVLLRNLERDVKAKTKRSGPAENDDSGFATGRAYTRTPSPEASTEQYTEDDQDIAALKAFRTPAHSDYVPTLFLSTDGWPSVLPTELNKYLLQPYVRWARGVVRHETDIVMLTHLIIYFTTTIPSALLLFRHFSYIHGAFHVLMQGYYMGTYTLMQHQHIHQRGILSKRFALFDHLFPYITDPLMGHTWNTYYFHHVKHHHVEGNGPDDLSSTIRYQRDSLFDFLQYVGRFYFLIWLDLPLYFLRKGRYLMGAQTAASELGTYAFYYAMSFVNAKATFFVYVMPLLLMRFGLMTGMCNALYDPVRR